MAIAFARLLRVAIMHRVTDSYGPIPYSKLESNESVYVEYDSQEAVYTKMFEELDEAIEILGRNTTLPAEAWSRYDGVYYGNIAQWLKYANSLKLRMAMRLSYVKSDVARAKAAAAIAGVLSRLMPTMRRCTPRRTARRSSTTTGETTVSEPTSSAT